MVRLPDWVPRSRVFWSFAAIGSSTGLYLYWDRHQARIAMQLFLREAEAIGNEPILDDQKLRRLTIVVGGRDGEEVGERKRLFRQYAAPLLLRAGVDWQWLEMNERALAKSLNQMHLEDPEKDDVQSFERQRLLKPMAERWMASLDGRSIEHHTSDPDATALLTEKYVTPVSRSFLEDGLVCLDSSSYSAIHDGLAIAAALPKMQVEEHNPRSVALWLQFWKRRPISAKADPGPVTALLGLLPCDPPGSTLARIRGFFARRHAAMAIGAATMRVAKSPPPVSSGKSVVKMTE